MMITVYSSQNSFELYSTARNEQYQMLEKCTVYTILQIMSPLSFNSKSGTWPVSVAGPVIPESPPLKEKKK